MLHSLRHFQIESLWYLSQHDRVVVCAPTGAGKSSIIYAWLLETKAKAVIIVPLQALSEQHSKHLSRLGVSNVTSLDHKDLNADVAIINPESLKTSWFKNWLNQNKPDHLVFDECHTYWEWGLTFRPSLLEVLPFSNIFIKELWLSATVSKFHFNDLLVKSKKTYFYFGSVETNKNIDVVTLNIAFVHRLDFIKNLATCCSETTLIFLWSKKECDNLCVYFNSQNINAISFHSGFTSSQKKELLFQIESQHPKIILATSAFGMGVDFSFIKNVVFWQTPPDWMSYLQMIGRAGRLSRGKAFFFRDTHSLVLSPWLYR